MKILTYNINKCNQEKIDKILSENADINIIPECGSQKEILLPKDYNMAWFGDEDCSYKGLGIIWKSHLNVIVPEWCNINYKYIMPFIVNGILIIAVWPTKRLSNRNKSYPQILFEALIEYEKYFCKYPTIITGDFNCYVGQSGETKKNCIQIIFDYLRNNGLVSLYHVKTNELLGCETKATYFHLFKEEKPFFIDYTFSNIENISFVLGEWDKTFSDHVPQLISIENC